MWLNDFCDDLPNASDYGKCRVKLDAVLERMFDICISELWVVKTATKLKREAKLGWFAHCQDTEGNVFALWEDDTAAS